MITVGFGDVIPTNIEEKLFTVNELSINYIIYY